MRQELRLKYESVAWETSTKPIMRAMESNRPDVARRLARLVIKDWEEERKPEIIKKFKGWLVENGVSLDDVELSQQKTDASP